MLQHLIWIDIKLIVYITMRFVVHTFSHGRAHQSHQGVDDVFISVWTYDTSLKVGAVWRSMLSRISLSAGRFRTSKIYLQVEADLVTFLGMTEQKLKGLLTVSITEHSAVTFQGHCSSLIKSLVSLADALVCQTSLSQERGQKVRWTSIKHLPLWLTVIKA